MSPTGSHLSECREGTTAALSNYQYLVKGNAGGRYRDQLRDAELVVNGVRAGELRHIELELHYCSVMNRTFGHSLGLGLQ